MRKSILILFLCLGILGLAHAQDQELSETYSFVDGTTLNFSSDFLVFNEEYDGFSMANSQTEIAVKVIFARTIEAERLQSLAQILQYFLPEVDISTAESIPLGEREALRFVQAITGENPYNETYFVLYVGDNSSAVVLKVLPNIQRSVFELTEEALVLNIAESVHFEDIRGDLSTDMGNSSVFEDGVLMEFRNTWTLDEAAHSLSSRFATMTVSAFTPEEIATANRKADPIEILYYELYQPNHADIPFNAEAIEIQPIRGREVVYYSFSDTVDGDEVQRIYLLVSLENGVIAVLNIQTRLGLDILADSDTQDMIQTLRPEGTLPPVTMMALGSSFNLQSGASVRFPDYWRARQTDTGVSLDSLDVNVFIQSFNTGDASAYLEDLPASLLSFTQPIDSTVQLSADLVQSFSLENERPALELTYTETTTERSYPRTVYLIQLEDSSLVFVSVTPQNGVNELSAVNLAEVRAILNTISPR